MPAMDKPMPIQPDRLKEYITAHILPAIGTSGRAFSLKTVSAGSRNLIWFLNLEGGSSYVLKAVSKRFRIKNIIWAHAQLKRSGIPVPKLLFADRTWKTAKTMGYYFACEKRVDGRPLDELGDGRRQHIAQAAGLFARMHSRRSFRWGKLKSFQVLGFKNYLLRKASERAGALAESGVSPAEKLLGWFAGKASAIRPLSRFSLCHGDVNMKNILLCTDGAIRLIDTEAFKFLPFQIEYFRLCYALCGFDAGLQQEFKNAYLAGAGRKRERDLKRCAPLYHGYVLLEIAWHFNKKLKQDALTEADRNGFMEIRKTALEQLTAIMKNNP